MWSRVRFSHPAPQAVSFDAVRRSHPSDAQQHQKTQLAQTETLPCRRCMKEAVQSQLTYVGHKTARTSTDHSRRGYELDGELLEADRYSTDAASNLHS